MEAEDVVEVIEHYRHDVLNHLQVIQGYIGLQYYAKAESNLTVLLETFHQERKLLQLNLPNVFLWFLQFNTRNNNLKLGYDVDIVNKNFKNNDLFIVEKLELIMQDFQSKCRSDHYYHAEVEFKDNIDFAEITVYIDIESKEAENESPFQLERISLEINENESIYRFHVSIDNEVT